MELYNDDCLKIMPQITDKSIDMILCDLPYGVTHNKWDSVIPFDKLWDQYNRIIKDNGGFAYLPMECLWQILWKVTAKCGDIISCGTKFFHLDF